MTQTFQEVIQEHVKFENAIGKPVTKWLRTQDVYSRHKQVKTKFQRRKTIVPGAQFQLQAELIDFSGLQKYNDNYKYILVMIDVFTKYAYTVSLKNTPTATMIAESKAVNLQKFRSGKGVCKQTVSNLVEKKRDKTFS